MKKVIRLTESDLMRIVKKVMNEEMMTSTPKPTIGSTLFVYKAKNVGENFTGRVCRINGDYFYLKSSTTGECAEYLWNPSGLKVTKVGNTYDITDPSFNILKQDCLRACKK
jgi:hypothetical protein